MISVIIPHLNQHDALRRCLLSLVAQEDIRDAFEIIVVDNGSSQSPDHICTEMANVTLLRQPVPGPGPARNVGIAAAAGDILAFIDADCVASPKWLAAIARRFERTPEASILGGNVCILCGDPARPTLLEAYESVFAFRMKEYIEKQGFTGAGNLAVRTPVFETVGPFGGIEIAEDAEWGKRASRLGYLIRYEPEMVVFHPARRSFVELTQKWDRHIAHEFTRARSKKLWWPRWVLRSAAVAVSPAAELRRILVSDRVSGSRSRMLALLGVVRLRLYRSRVMLALARGADPAQLSGRWNRPETGEVPGHG